MSESLKPRRDGYPRVAVRISPEEYERLRTLAGRDGQTVNGRIRWLIQRDIAAQKGAV